jgi:hypothetical protein
LQFLDTRPEGFSATDAYKVLELLGPEGRATYTRVYYEGYDIIHPICFSITLGIVLSMLFPRGTSLARLNLLALLALVFDLLENFFIYQMLVTFPDHHKIESWAPWASSAVMTKWLVLITNVILVLFGIVRKTFGREVKRSVP